LIKLKFNFIILFLVVVLISFNGCNYSFTGASVPAHLKTVAIPMLEDRSGSGIFKLKEDLTTVLTQKFVEDNSLQVADRVNANCIVEGVITSTSDTPMQISGGEKIKTNRFTINVKVVFRDLINKKVILEKTFSGYKDYSTEGSVTTARQEAITEAIKLVAEDILLGVVSNW
jgi:hypothetical protein